MHKPEFIDPFLSELERRLVPKHSAARPPKPAAGSPEKVKRKAKRKAAKQARKRNRGK